MRCSLRLCPRCSWHCLVLSSTLYPDDHGAGDLALVHGAADWQGGRWGARRQLSGGGHFEWHALRNDDAQLLDLLMQGKMKKRRKEQHLQTRPAASAGVHGEHLSDPDLASQYSPAVGLGGGAVHDNRGGGAVDGAVVAAAAAAAARGRRRGAAASRSQIIVVVHLLEGDQSGCFCACF